MAEMFKFRREPDPARIIEVDAHHANLRRGKFTRLDAHVIAEREQGHDKSDPSTYSRVFCQLMVGSAVPEDFPERKQFFMPLGDRRGVKVS